MTRLTRVLVTAFLLSASASASAQNLDDPALILRAAASAVRERLPSGPVAIDPRIARPGHQYKSYYADPTPDVSHNPITLSSLLAVVGQGSVARIEDIYVRCAPKSCQLKNGIVAAVAFSEPAVHGDTATVDIYYTAVTGEVRQPIVNSDLTAIVVRVPGGWRVADLKLNRIT